MHLDIPRRVRLQQFSVAFLGKVTDVLYLSPDKLDDVVVEILVAHRGQFLTSLACEI